MINQKGVERKFKIKIFFFLLFSIVSLIVLGACNTIDKKENAVNADIPISMESFKLNTIVSISIYDSNNKALLDGALDLCDKYEQIYSRTLETSELYQLNHGLLDKANKSGNSYLISDKLSEILECGLYYSKLSNGAFDITVAPITELWDFTSTQPVVPDKKVIKDAILKVGYQSVSLEENTITLKKDHMGIDLGAIAKGYIADRIKDYLLEQGVKSAVINLGGNILTIGEKPNKEAFKIGIQKPFADRNEIVAAMSIKDMSVVSSGVYERYFKQDGTLYHHIINPFTGYPYKNGLISVTIVSPKSVDGDGLSTTCFALGLEKGMKLIESLENTYAIFITEDYTLHYTKGFLENIEVTTDMD